MKTKYKYNRYIEDVGRSAVHFPGRHPVRNNPESNWRKLYTPLFGNIFSNHREYNSQYALDAFLGSSGVDAPNTLYSVISAPKDTVLLEPINIIRNSRLRLKIGDVPFLWFDNAGVYEQVVTYNVARGQPLYCLIDSDNAVSIDVTYMNLVTGTPATINITDLSGVVSLTNADPIEITGLAVSGDISNLSINLWNGDSSALWTRHPEDDVFFVDRDGPSDYILKDGDIEVIEVDGIHDMFNRATPTRASFDNVAIPNDTQLQSTRSSFGFEIGFHGEPYTSEFSVDANQIIRTLDSHTIYRYTLKQFDSLGIERDLIGDVMAMYLTSDVISCIIKKEVVQPGASSSSSSTTPAYEFHLVYIAPDYTNPETEELIVISSINLGEIPEILDKDISLYARYNDSYSLVISVPDVGGNIFYQVPLYYDYFYFDDGEGDFVFRHKYDNLEGLGVANFVYSPYYNHLDQHGLLRGLPRLEEEANIDYKNRLTDYSSFNPTGNNRRGLINGINHRLGLPISNDVIVFDYEVNLVKRDEVLYISKLSDTISETVIRDPNYELITLSEVPYNILSVEVDGVIWPSSLYSNLPFSDVITFNHYPLIEKGASVVVNYSFYSSIYDLKIISVRNLFNLLQDDGHIVSSAFDLLVIAEFAAINIMDISDSGLDVSLDYAPASIDSIRYDALSSFQDLTISQAQLGNLQGITVELRKQMHDTWDKQKLDVDRWDMSVFNNIGGGLLPAYNDQSFSWFLGANNRYYSHADPLSISKIKQGFEISDLTSGVNLSKADLELYNDLKVESISNQFKPMVNPGYFYVKEMRLYLFAVKKEISLTDKSVVKIDMDAMRLSNPFVDFDTLIAGTYIWEGDDLYTYSLDSSEPVSSKFISGIDSITGLLVTESILSYIVDDGQFYLDAYSGWGPVVCTDVSGGKTELQFSIGYSGILTPLSAFSAPQDYMVSYETAEEGSLSELDIDVRTERGFLYLYFDNNVNESIDIVGTNVALVNGSSKGRARNVYDPDESLSSGIDLDPGQVIDTRVYAGIASPSGPTSVANPNLHQNASGYGHGMSIDYSN